MHIRHAAAAAALALLAAAPPASAEALRACEPWELGDAGTPVTVDAERVGDVERAMVAGRRYRVERAPELANGRYPAGSPYRQSSARPETIMVSGPLGMNLEPLPPSGVFRGGHGFTAPRERSLTLSISWVQDLQAQSGASAGECRATAPLTFPVFTLNPATVSAIRFLRSRHLRLGSPTTDDKFQIVVNRAPEPADPAPVVAIVRLRAGSTRPPSLHSRPVARLRLGRPASFRRAGMMVERVSVPGPRGTVRPAWWVGLDTFVRRGRTVRFGFSIEVLQDTRRLGGMRGGAVCRVAFASRANRWYRRCDPVGFAGRP